MQKIISNLEAKIGNSGKWDQENEENGVDGSSAKK
jgi:hypothetical protein